MADTVKGNVRNRIYDSFPLDPIPQLVNLDGMTNGESKPFIPADENTLVQEWGCPLGVTRNRWIQEELRALAVFRAAAAKRYIPTAEELEKRMGL